MKPFLEQMSEYLNKEMGEQSEDGAARQAIAAHQQAVAQNVQQSKDMHEA